MHSPFRLWQLFTGHWAPAALAAAVAHSIFTHLDQGADTAEAIAQRAALPVRGVQALLDGLVAIEVVHRRDGRYVNAGDTGEFLVEGKPRYFGAYARIITGHGDGSMRQWSQLADAVKMGAPIAMTSHESRNAEFFKQLVLAIMPISFPIAETVCRQLGFADAGPVTMLDLGGGSGVYSAVMLSANRAAKAIQLDLPHVNEVARSFVSSFGVGERFTTVDGDLEDFEPGSYQVDFIILSNVLHHLSPASSMTLLRKLRAALRPGGTLVTSDLLLEDDRSGPPLELLFNLGMLLQTKEGEVYRRADVAGWLEQAGWQEISLLTTGTPFTLIYAR